jgi:hypothetical protein
LTVELMLLGQSSSVASVHLCYRRVHQVQPYQTADMQMQGNHCRAAIPAEYTNTPYPLEYYFELRNGAGGSPTHDSALGTPGQAWMYPGFDATLTNQPYFVVHPS